MGRMCLTQRVEGAKGKRDREGSSPGELLQDGRGPTSLGSSFLPAAHAEQFSPWVGGCYLELNMHQ